MDMLTCPECGAFMNEDVSTCRECGREYTGEDEPDEGGAAEKGNGKKIYGVLAVFFVIVGGTALLLFTGLVPNPLRDRSTAAIVNGEKILAQDVDKKMEIYKRMYGQSGQMDFSSPEGKTALTNMKRQILDSMIQEKILRTEAIREKISVSKEEIEARINGIRQSMNFSDADFDLFLKNHSMSLQGFETRMEAEILISKLIDKGVKDRGLTREAWLKELMGRARVERFDY